jgi:hypothetical protein
MTRAALSGRAAIALVLAPFLLAACAPSTLVPADAQVVHVVVNVADVRLEPATARSGDVYLALEEPTSSIVFVQRTASPSDSPGPLSADDVSRVRSGDLQSTTAEAFDVGGCTLAQRNAERGRLRIPGGCGNVFRLPNLTAGSYAFVASDPATAGGAVPMAVLLVAP